jgi:hypothetical protein
VRRDALVDPCGLGGGADNAAELGGRQRLDRVGHAKLDTTALYTRVANATIRAVTSPLDRLASSIEGRPRPEA